MQYRVAAEKIEAYLDVNMHNTFIFAGFNALNKAEEVIIQEILAKGKGEIFWDIDKSFLQPNHIAGHFIREYVSSWEYYKNNSISFVEEAIIKEKRIQVIGANGSVNQMLAVKEGSIT